MVKMVHFILCVFYHNFFLKGGKKIIQRKKGTLHPGLVLIQSPRQTHLLPAGALPSPPLVRPRQAPPPPGPALARPRSEALTDCADLALAQPDAGVGWGPRAGPR